MVTLLYSCSCFNELATLCSLVGACCSFSCVFLISFKVSGNCAASMRERVTSHGKPISREPLQSKNDRSPRSFSQEQQHTA